jgi:SAM-dependent methyltransferase
MRGRDSSAPGWQGWDAYAPFYDWENQRTVGRRDIRFWQAVVVRERARVLELGCGTGRVLSPLLSTGAAVVGVDRSAPMLARCRRRLRRGRRFRPGGLVRADVRALPYAPGSFGAIVAPYGLLQSLVSDKALDAALDSVASVLAPGGLFGIDLVPDVPRWREYSRRISLSGRLGREGTPIRLIESVRQDRARRLTIFDQEYMVGRGRARRVHRFSLSFRTLEPADLRRRLERAGFIVDAVLGDYRGGPWDERADAWIVLARRAGPAARRARAGPRRP